MLATCYDKLQALMVDITDASSESLWRFLELLITKPSGQWMHTVCDSHIAVM